MARKKGLFGLLLGGVAKAVKPKTKYKNPFAYKKPRKKKGYKY